MAENLVLRLYEKSSECSWIVVDGDGRVVVEQRFGTLIDALAPTTGRKVIVLVPGEEIVTTDIDLPPASPSRLRQMLPFSLEDRFAEDISKLNFAAGPKLESGNTLVSVVAKEKLDGWLQQLAEANIVPNAVYADTDGVPDTPATFNLILEGDTALGRSPGKAALSIEGLGLDQAFKAMAAEQSGESEIQHAMLFMSAQAREANEAAIALLASELSSINVRVLDRDALPIFAAKLVNQPGTNLLQGPYAPKSNWAALLQPWRFAAMLLVGLIGMTLISNLADYFSMRRHDAELTAAVETNCAEQFRATILRQCEAQLQARLRSSGDTSQGGENFLSTLSTIAEFAGDDSRFETLSYRNRVMNVQMVAPDVSAVDQFSQQLNGTGRFTVAVQSSNPQPEGGVEARVEIVGASQ